MILFWLFILVMVVQCAFALYFFVRIFDMPTPKAQTHSPLPVSIIICAKNEAENLKKNLPAILSQQYHNEAGKPLYEVIVVNDASDDDTTQALQDLELQYDQLWDIIIAKDAKRDLQGKKFALGKGVAIAKHDLLLLTDADCAPASDQWLRQMAVPLHNGKEIVGGYGGYISTQGLLNAFIRWETIHSFLQYSTYALAGKPYMAVGRNMACTKATLQKAQQSEVWNALPSGDDDLLVNVAGNATNTAIVAEPSAFTYSEAKATFKSWVAQKQRHLSTGKYYKNDIKLLLGAYGVSHAAMWLSFFILLATPCRDAALIALGIRCGVYWLIWARAASKLNEKNLIYLFPFFDIAWMVYNFAFLPYITWKNKKHWT